MQIIALSGCSYNHFTFMSSDIFINKCGTLTYMVLLLIRNAIATHYDRVYSDRVLGAVSYHRSLEYLRNARASFEIITT